MLKGIDKFKFIEPQPEESDGEDEDSFDGAAANGAFEASTAPSNNANKLGTGSKENKTETNSVVGGGAAFASPALTPAATPAQIGASSRCPQGRNKAKDN